MASGHPPVIPLVMTGAGLILLVSAIKDLDPLQAAKNIAMGKNPLDAKHNGGSGSGSGSNGGPTINPDGSGGKYPNPGAGDPGQLPGGVFPNAPDPNSGQAPIPGGGVIA